MSDGAELCPRPAWRRFRGVVCVGLAIPFAAMQWRLLQQDLAARSVMVPMFQGRMLPAAWACEQLRAAREWGADRADVLVRLGESAGALRATPLDAVAHYQRGLALTQQGDVDGGARHLQIAASASGNRPALLIKLGDFHLEAWRTMADPEHLIDAVECYRQAAGRDPDSVMPVIERLGVTLRDANELANLLPATAAARESLAAWLCARGDGAAALQVLEAHPAQDSPSWQHGHARALLAQGDVDDALAGYTLMVRMQPRAESLAGDLEREIAGVSAARRAVFFAALGDCGARYQLAAARAHVAAGQHAAAMTLVDAILRRYHPLALLVRRATDRDVQIACHELRAADWSRRGWSRQVAIETRAIALLEPTAARLKLAAQRWREAGDQVEARTCLREALEAARAAGDAAAIAALESDLAT